MDEIADLLRELIAEVQGLRADIDGLRGPMGHTLGDVHDQLVEIEEKVPAAITGPLGFTIQDVVDRLGTPSVFGLEDLHSRMWELIEAVREA